MRLSVTCAHCGKQFAATAPPPASQVQYFQESRGGREVLVTCTHCKKENKVRVPK
jgi:hypothetical protein